MFKRGVFVLPDRCPRCGAKGPTEPVEVTTLGNSRMVFGGVKYQKLSLRIPHCKPCSVLVESAYSKRAILILPALLLALGVYGATERLTYAYLMFLASALAIGSLMQRKKGEPSAGVSIVIAGKDKVIVTSEHKAWIADLQIVNS